jgi:hypothetical protein
MISRAVDAFNVLLRELQIRQVIPHHETFSTTIQSSYSSTKG